MNEVAKSRSVPAELFGPGIEDGEIDRENAERMLAAFCPQTKTRKRSGTIAKSRWDKAMTRVQERLRSADWQEADPIEFVALYHLLHTRVYGVEPGELGTSQRMRAMTMARLLLAREFNHPREMAAFMRWVWIREEQRERWRKQSGSAGGRIGWYFQFDGRLVTDWRLEARRLTSPSSAK